ncbi:unnamed protein product [Prorocentrum cordatum]|uniref:Uncharacterized protein n=1 Tax=Prorocentrum cordatum TaxID=2364126 RepID=A0ABN9QPZ4_9DINO|nr:unnamed protein product [Polarella glacialis]
MTGSVTVLETYELCWASWAGEPEVGVIVDRAKGFLGSFSEHMSSRGCRFASAAKAAAAWHIAEVERHGDLWQDVLKAVMEINQAKNSLSRRSGFSPAQWVLGRDIRLPADLMDDGEVERIGAIAASATPTSKFARKCALRQAAREAHAKIANEDAIKRAELRQVRPERGPFNVGDWVFYYDQKEQGKRPESVINWRGVARVIGHEGKHTIWIVHRGITIACAPEHLAKASDEEVRAWLVTAQEADLIDTTGTAGGSGFIDLRRRPLPPEFRDGGPVQPELAAAQPPPEAPPPEVPQPAEREAPAEPLVQEEEPPAEEVTEEPYQEEPPMMQQGPPPPIEPRGATQAEDPMEDAVKDFVNEAVRSDQVPMGDERGPDLDDVHTPAASFPPRPAEGAASRYKEGRPAEEAAERGAKRQKLLDDVPESIKMDDAFQVYEDEDSMINEAHSTYDVNQSFYAEHEVSKEVSAFGVERNEFEDSYEAGSTVAKKGRKELHLKELDEAKRQLFIGPGGSDEKEWKAWQDLGACDTLSLGESEQIWETKRDLIIPAKWVRTNESEGVLDAEFEAKSRMMAQGFKDKSLGEYRGDAPTASNLAEAMVLLVIASMGMIMSCGYIKNAYFSGRGIGREIYISQPRGGLKGLHPRQLLRAKKAIDGFAEAARLFWLAFCEVLEKDGWVSLFWNRFCFTYATKQALWWVFYALTWMICWLECTRQKLNFSKWLKEDFVFRGREIQRLPNGDVGVTMKGCSLNMKTVPIPRERKKELTSPLTDDEVTRLRKATGEISWLSRQLRADLAFQAGQAQRAMVAPCIADLVKVNRAINDGKRGADYMQKFPKGIDLSRATVLIECDSGHANGNPESDEIARYKSIGGHFLFIAGEWLCVLLEEVFNPKIDLKDWQKIVARRSRVFLTDAKSVHDYLTKEGSGLSRDKRMAIEGALLKEALRQPNTTLRWVDGLQNLADILTKEGVDLDYFRHYLRTNQITIQQDQAAVKIKEKKRSQRAARKSVAKPDRAEADRLRRERSAAGVREEDLQDD